MILVAVLSGLVALWIFAMVGLAFVLPSWGRVADGMHNAGADLRDAIGWPHRNLAQVHMVWPSEGIRM